MLCVKMVTGDQAAGQVLSKLAVLVTLPFFDRACGGDGFICLYVFLALSNLHSGVDQVCLIIFEHRPRLWMATIVSKGIVLPNSVWIIIAEKFISQESEHNHVRMSHNRFFSSRKINKTKPENNYRQRLSKNINAVLLKWLIK